MQRFPWVGSGPPNKCLDLVGLAKTPSGRVLTWPIPIWRYQQRSTRRGQWFLNDFSMDWANTIIFLFFFCWISYGSFRYQTIYFDTSHWNVNSKHIPFHQLCIHGASANRILLFNEHFLSIWWQSCYISWNIWFWNVNNESQKSFSNVSKIWWIWKLWCFTRCIGISILAEINWIVF